MASSTGRIQKKKRDITSNYKDVIEETSIVGSSRSDLVSSLITTKSLTADLSVKSQFQNLQSPTKSAPINKRQTTEKSSVQTKSSVLQTQSTNSPVVNESRLTPEPTAAANVGTTRIAKLSTTGRKRMAGSGDPDWVQPLQEAILHNEVKTILL